MFYSWCFVHKQKTKWAKNKQNPEWTNKETNKTDRQHFLCHCSRSCEQSDFLVFYFKEVGYRLAFVTSLTSFPIKQVSLPRLLIVHLHICFLCLVKKKRCFISNWYHFSFISLWVLSFRTLKLSSDFHTLNFHWLYLFLALFLYCIW